MKLGRKLEGESSRMCVQEKMFDLAGPKDQKVLKINPQNPSKYNFSS